MRGIAAGGARDTRRAETAVEDPALPGWRKGGACRTLACQSARWIVSGNRSGCGVRIVSLSVALEGRRASEAPAVPHPWRLGSRAGPGCSRSASSARVDPGKTARCSRDSKSNANAQAENGSSSTVVGDDPAVPCFRGNGPQRSMQPLHSAMRGFAFGGEQTRTADSGEPLRSIECGLQNDLVGMNPRFANAAMSRLLSAPCSKARAYPSCCRHAAGWLSMRKD